jgi:DNA-binding NtrC family response regulator
VIGVYTGLEFASVSKTDSSTTFAGKPSLGSAAVTAVRDDDDAEGSDATASKGSSAMVLLVEPDDDIASRLITSLLGIHDVRRCGTFNDAREQLQRQLPDLLVSNLRLSEYNGLHLVYLATIAPAHTRAVVYTIYLEPVLAKDVQRAGAFYDTVDCLEVSLRTYLGTALPPTDRRDPQRREVRGGGAGRRVTDSPTEPSV